MAASSKNQSPVQILGLEAVNAQLALLTKSQGQTAIKRGMRRSLGPMRDRVRELTPVKSGQVKRAVRILAGRTKKGRLLFRVVIGERDFVGKTFYGAFRNYGTRKMEGAHFMDQAFAEKARETADLAEAEILAQVMKLLGS